MPNKYPPQDNHQSGSSSGNSHFPSFSQQLPLSQQPTQPLLRPVPPTPGQFAYPPVQPSPDSHVPYRKSIAVFFTVLYGCFWIFTLLGATNPTNKIAIFLSNLGIGLFWGILVGVLVIDWRGSTSLDGLLPWRKIKSGGMKLLLGVGCFFFSFFLLGIYLGRRLIRKSHHMQGQRSAPKKRVQIGLVAWAVVTLFAVVVYETGNANGTGLWSSTSTVPKALLQGSSPSVSLISSSPTQIMPTATIMPSPTVPPSSTPVPTTKPTQAPARPTQPPAHLGVNGNPWGYDFDPGYLIYNPPSGFCGYFACIANFGNGRGYVVECKDQTYSKSGGIQGSCSRYGGNLRPLYSH